MYAYEPPPAVAPVVEWEGVEIEPASVRWLVDDEFSGFVPESPDQVPVALVPEGDSFVVASAVPPSSVEVQIFGDFRFDGSPPPGRPMVIDCLALDSGCVLERDGGNVVVRLSSRPSAPALMTLQLEYLVELSSGEVDSNTASWIVQIVRDS